MRPILAICTSIVMIFFALPATAQVIVNGQQLSDQEIRELAIYSCGPLYPGNYWLDMATGNWGYAGSYQVMGHIRDRCGGQRRKSLSERGLLYGPGELLR
jgi:hypothetical protein